MAASDDGLNGGRGQPGLDDGRGVQCEIPREKHFFPDYGSQVLGEKSGVVERDEFLD